jgi:hypothetical protein
MYAILDARSGSGTFWTGFATLECTDTSLPEQADSLFLQLKTAFLSDIACQPIVSSLQKSNYYNVRPIVITLLIPVNAPFQLLPAIKCYARHPKTGSFLICESKTFGKNPNRFVRPPYSSLRSP